MEHGSVSEVEFAEALKEEGVIDWLGSTAPGEEAPAETESQPRDAQGRFTKATEEVAGSDEEGTESPEELTEEPETVTSDEVPEQPDGGDYVLEIDDDLQAVLDKYNGDVGKALKALGESQSFIGRQANELGDLRKELAEIRQALQQPQQQPVQYVGPYVNDPDENPQEFVLEALERGDSRAAEKAIRAWGEYEPFEATTFLIQLQQQQAEMAAAPASTAPATPAYNGPSVEQAMSEVVQRHPDVQKYLPKVEQVAKEFPSLRDSMRSGTPAVQAQAFEELLKIAKARSSTSDTQTAMRRLVLKTQEEVRAEKAEAAVVSAKNQSAATESQGDEDFWEAWDREAARYSSGGFHRS